MGIRTANPRPSLAALDTPASVRLRRLGRTRRQGGGSREGGGGGRAAVGDEMSGCGWQPRQKYQAAPTERRPLIPGKCFPPVYTEVCVWCFPPAHSPEGRDGRNEARISERLARQIVHGPRDPHVQREQGRDTGGHPQGGRGRETRKQKKKNNNERGGGEVVWG
jgi:hypothetical protein